MDNRIDNNRNVAPDRSYTGWIIGALAVLAVLGMVMYGANNTTTADNASPNTPAKSVTAPNTSPGTTTGSSTSAPATAPTPATPAR
jgi:multidrug efflux pump subunit AcrA (membrane-fusion protein)